MGNVKRSKQPGALVSRGYASVRPDGNVQVETGRLPAPQNLYDADFCWAVPRLDAVSFFFAKEKFGGQKEFRSRLELRFPTESFDTNYMGSSKDFRATLKGKYGLNYGVDVDSPVAEWMTYRAEKEHSEWVNFDLLAYAGSQVSLDFFHLSPAAVAMYARTKNLSLIEINPVVRVLTTLPELGRLMAMCEKIDTSTGSDVRLGVRG